MTDKANGAEPVGAAQAEARGKVCPRCGAEEDTELELRLLRDQTPMLIREWQHYKAEAERLRAALSVQPAEPPEDGVAPWSADDVLRRALEETVRVLRQCGLIRECAVHFAALATAKPGASEGRDQPETPSGATPKAGAAEQKASDPG